MDELLRRCGGKRPLAQRMIELFSEDVTGHLQSICESIRAGDHDRIRTGAHLLKGAAATVAAHETSRIAGAIEKANDGQPLDDLVRQLSAQVERCRVYGADRNDFQIPDGI